MELKRATLQILKKQKAKSITRTEYDRAQENSVPTYILIEKSVFVESQTYQKNLKNKEIDNKKIQWASVDSVKVFEFLDVIYKKNINNPRHAFESSNEIHRWLRNQ